MPDPQAWRRRPGWGADGRRPPWWPDNEAWPPAGAAGVAAWQHARRRFMRRVGLFVGLAILLLVGALSLLFYVLASTLGTALPPPHIGLLVVLVLVAVFVIGGAARRAARPLGDLIEAAGRIEAGDLDTRVPERGPSEVRGLAHAFNQMAARLQADLDQRRRLLADVSHELRTPLAVIQGNLEALADGVYPPDHDRLSALVEESRTLARLIDDLRTLSMAEAGELRLHPEATEVGSLLREVTASFEPAAATAGIELKLSADQALPSLQIDSVRTRQVVSNLLANAMNHTQPGGEVSVRASRTASGIQVEVADSGSGMPAHVLERVFERFYRGPESRGSGLGLPIARELVTAQGGTIRASSAEGAGTTVTFTLPAPPL